MYAQILQQFNSASPTVKWRSTIMVKIKKVKSKKYINVDNSPWSRRYWRCLRRHATPCDFSPRRFMMTSLFLCVSFLTYLQKRGLCFWICKPRDTGVYRLNSHPRFVYPLLIINQTQVWLHSEQPSVNLRPLRMRFKSICWAEFVCFVTLCLNVLIHWLLLQKS